MSPARLALWLLLPLFCGLAPVGARAAEMPVDWPGKDVTLTIPFAQGNESDAYYGLLHEAFAEKTSWRLKARYFSAEAGVQAWARMVDDEPDGYTLTGINIPHIILRTLQPDSGVNPQAMRICAIGVYTPCVLWGPKQDPVAPKAPVNSRTRKPEKSLEGLEAFLDAARKAPDTVVVAGPGRYSAAQLAARMLDRAAGVRSLYLPYSGTAEAAKAVANGKAVLFWAHTVNLSAFADMRPLAVAAEKRHPGLPGTPTFRELGYDMVQGVYRGIAVPEKTPPEILAQVAAVFANLHSTAAFRAKAGARGFTPLHVPYETIPAFFNEQNKKYYELAEDFDLKNQ